MNSRGPNHRVTQTAKNARLHCRKCSTINFFALKGEIADGLRHHSHRRINLCPAYNSIRKHGIDRRASNIDTGLDNGGCHRHSSICHSDNGAPAAQKSDRYSQNPGECIANPIHKRISNHRLLKHLASTYRMHGYFRSIRTDDRVAVFLAKGSRKLDVRWRVKSPCVGACQRFGWRPAPALPALHPYAHPVWAAHGAARVVWRSGAAGWRR